MLHDVDAKDLVKDQWVNGQIENVPSTKSDSATARRCIDPQQSLPSLAGAGGWLC